MRKLFASDIPKESELPLHIDSGPEETTEAAEQPGKHVQCKRMKGRHFDKRVKSELALEKELPWHFEPGCSYHCISFGDVDSLTYLRAIVKQQKIEYCLISTWCMAITDAKEIENWIEKGYIGRIDFYVGEIFQGSYSGVYSYLKDVAKRNNGRICIFKNHSKVMAGFGEHFDFVIESSANIKTNPRCEQATITIDTGLSCFYKDFFDEVNSFNEDFEGWSKYEFNQNKK